MTKRIGWVFLIGSFIWFGIVSYAGLEPSMLQIISNSATLIAGAILIK